MKQFNYEIKSLKWDTKYFGIKSARVEIYDQINDETIKRILNELNKFKFITIKNHNNNNVNNYLIGKATNAFLTDINVNFIKIINSEDDFNEAGNVKITNKLPINDEIIRAASSCFNYSRFFNDKHLKETKTKIIYSNWVKNAFNDKDKYFSVHSVDNYVQGFILFHFMDNLCIIDLLCVEQNYSRQGIGKTLMKSVEKYCIEKSVFSISVGTQIDNINAVNFYVKQGYIYKSCHSIYHLWNI